MFRSGEVGGHDNPAQALGTGLSVLSQEHDEGTEAVHCWLMSATIPVLLNKRSAVILRSVVLFHHLIMVILNFVWK